VEAVEAVGDTEVVVAMAVAGGTVAEATVVVATVVRGMAV